MNANWYETLRSIVSKGSQAERPGSLAGLAAAREIHQGQFFTPDPVAALMWRILQRAFRAFSKARKLSILDNSVGSGRLLQFASAEHHRLFGVDTDAASIARLGEVAEAAGFDCQFEACGMEAIRPVCMDAALINPPFSLHLESPLLVPYPCTSYGRFGPGTSATSQAYALAQALDAAALVVALLPSTFAAEVADNPVAVLGDAAGARLAAHLELPAGVFREEGTEVRVSLLCFNAFAADQVVRAKLQSLDDVLPAFALELPEQYPGRAHLGAWGVEDEGPSIVLPVTGEKTVRVVHDGRCIGLRFACGLIQAKVLNAVLDARVESRAPSEHRHPRGVRYCGQGRLDLEVHLAQPDPWMSLQDFLADIRAAGGEPATAPGFFEHFRRRLRRHLKAAIPLRHTVWVKPGTAAAVDQIAGRARRDHVANAKVWGSPMIKAGSVLAFQRNADGYYEFEVAGSRYRVTGEELHDRYEVTEGAKASGWEVVHQGLRARFPEQAAALRRKAVALGIEPWLSWQFQLDDLVELVMKKGVAVAWEMGLGKARLAIALILLSGCRRGLITVEAGLVAEMERELKSLPIPAEDWQIIRRPADLDSLRTINVISYERLRLRVGGDGARAKLPIHLTYAGRLRRRVGVVVSDEGDLLANPTSLQSQALWQLSAKRRYVLSGTPIANVPRDVQPVLAYAAGDGTAANPWGWWRGHLEANWGRSMSQAVRGRDAFRDRFVVAEWTTREFEDTLTEGAKREIPRIADLQGYRTMLAPHVKRRIADEPEVAACVRMPRAERFTTVLPWDEAHLEYYLRIAEEFRGWYMDMRRGEGRRGNLVAILARIMSICLASDYPQHGVEGFGVYSRLTSKQRYVINRVAQLAKEGHKTIVYAENPGALALVSRHLEAVGVANTLFHGALPVKTRMRALDEEFRFGPNPALLASLGVTQKGLNLPQADRVILMSRSWSATVEEQAIGRPLRPQQRRQVEVEYVHLDGGIDFYKDQLVAFKRDSARAGLDWSEPETGDMEFLHLDTILERFCKDLAKLKGVKRSALREALAA